MDSHRIKVIIIVGLALMFAVYLGIAAATAQATAIAWIAGGLSVVLFFALGKNVWMLIPLALMLSGGINALPGVPLPWWAAMAACGLMYVMRFVMRRMEHFQFSFNWLDFAIFLQIIAVAQAFMRNPTGLSIFGGDVAGGKPYIIFGMAFAAYALLSVTRTDIKVIKWVVLASILVALGDGALGMASQLFPFVAMAVLPIYSGVNFGAAQGAIVVMDEGSRLSAGKNIGQALGLTACSLYPPGHTMLPFRVVPFLLMSGAVILILLSGFRSTLGWLGMVFIVGCLVRRRYLDILIAGVIGMVGLVFILGSGMSANLPIALQRTLSIIPFADVDDTIRHQAQRSTDWRVEMWILALTTDQYISNKWLGDGFNYSAMELQAQQDATFGDRRRARGMNMADMMMARGSYHGFHVETIRFTGAFGLLCALIAMGIWFRYALKLLKHFKGRPEWGYVIFICLPFLIHPFYYMLVFGAYRSGFTELLVASGMLKILDNIRVRELAAARAEAKEPKEQPAATAIHRPHRGFPAPAMRSVGTRGLTRP